MSGKTTAIFLVNKAMSHEARAWFYGSREFSFQNSMACRRLLEAIGSNRAPLRYITISRVTMSAQATFQSLLWLLKDTKKLADLTLLTDDAEILMRAILGCSMRTDLKKSTHFMLPFSQFLAQLHDVRSDPNEAKYIVTFGFNGSSRVNGKASDFAWFRKEMLRQVKAEVAKLEVKREE